MLSFSAKFAHDLILFAGQNGASCQQLFNMTGLNPQHLNREDIRIPANTMAKVWEEAINQTEEPFLALQLGLERYSAQQTTNLIMANSLTVREAFELAIKYSQLIANVMTTSLHEDDKCLYLQFDLNPLWSQQPASVTLDCLLIAMISATRSIPTMTGEENAPVSISLAAPRPVEYQFLCDIFDCPIEFEAECNRIGFAKSVQMLSVRHPDQGLQAAIRSYADNLCLSLSNDTSLSETIHKRLFKAMPKPIPIDEMAIELNLSLRTMQRKLKQEGITYRELVESVRLDIANVYLSSSQFSLDDIANMSGYSDAPSFIRAYKRKFQRTPKMH